MTRVVVWLAVSSKPQAADDKISIPEQRRLILEYCAAHGHTIVETLTVPGHSRSDTDVLALLDEYERKRIYAYRDLHRHWRANDFDLLIAYDSSRIARSKSLITLIFENVLKGNRRIVLLDGGTFDASNADMGIVMCSASATAGVARLAKMRDAKMDVYIEEGKPVSSGVCMSHRRVYDSKGEFERLELNPQYTQLWQDAARLLLNGVAWGALEEQLFAQFGHVNPRTGRQFQMNRIYCCFTNPTFWGHNARHHRTQKGGKIIGSSRNIRISGSMWFVEPGHEIPPGVKIGYNKYPPVLTGELADQIKALLAQKQRLQGRARSHTPHRFSGLFVCDECGYTVSGQHNRRHNYRYYRCFAHFNFLRGSPTRKDCSQSRALSAKKAQAYIDALLRKVDKEGNMEMLQVQPRAEAPSPAPLKKELATLQTQAQRLAHLLSASSEDEPDMLGALESERAHINARLKAVKLQLAELSQDASVSGAQRGQMQAFEEIMSQGLKNFWLREDWEINQTLHRLFGKLRLTVRDGKIVGRAVAKKRYQHQEG